LIAGAVAIGALLLRFSCAYGGVQNNVPTHLPFPGRGFSVGDWFTLPGGGSFAIEVVTPASDEEKALLHREQPQVPCNLTLVVTGPSGFRLQRTINRLRNGGWTRDTTIYFPEELLELPSGGQYTISISNRGPDSLFGDRGALIQLARVEPSGHELLYPITAGIAYLCFAFAIAITLFVKSRR